GQDGRRARSRGEDCMTRNSLAVASALAVAAMLIAAFLVGSMLPAGAELPTHWGVSGEADGFSGKWPALLFPVALAVGMSALFYFLPSLEPRGDGLKRSQGLYAAVWMSMLLMAGVIELSVIAVALHWPLHAFHLIAAGLGVMFIMIGNQLGKSRSMYLIGIRTPWPLASEEVWVKTHRLGAPAEAGGGDVRRIGALVWLDADPGECLVDLLVQRLERLLRRDPRPQSDRLAPPIERAEAVQRHVEGRVVDPAQGRVDVLRHVPVDLADETQGEVELLLVLPTRAGHAADQSEQPVEDRARRADG